MFIIGLDTLLKNKKFLKNKIKKSISKYTDNTCIPTCGSGRSGRPRWGRRPPNPAHGIYGSARGDTLGTCADAELRLCRSRPAGRLHQTASDASPCSGLSAPTDQLQYRTATQHSHSIILLKNTRTIFFTSQKEDLYNL